MNQKTERKKKLKPERLALLWLPGTSPPKSSSWMPKTKGNNRNLISSNKQRRTTRRKGRERSHRRDGDRMPSAIEKKPYNPLPTFAFESHEKRKGKRKRDCHAAKAKANTNYPLRRRRCRWPGVGTSPFDHPLNAHREDRVRAYLTRFDCCCRRILVKSGKEHKTSRARMGLNWMSTRPMLRHW